MNSSRRAVLTAGLGAIMPATAPATAPAARAGANRLITGVNLAGLEFKSGALPGRLDEDYVAPTAAELDYYAERGARAVRVPFLWERLQPQLGGAFDEAYWRELARLIAETRARQMRIILDPHQYGRRRLNGQPHIIGESADVGAAHFAAFWSALARRCRGGEHVVFGLQNEPHDQDIGRLVGVQNAALAAIRATGARNLVLVSGGAWSGAHSWTSSGNAEAFARVRDPASNMAFDVHQFLDGDASGTHGGCVDNADARLAPFTTWARQARRRGFLSEFGGGGGPECVTALTALLEHVAANRDVWVGWTYWAGGPWWDEDYPLSVEPLSLSQPRDRPQMAVLRRYFE